MVRGDCLFAATGVRRLHAARREIPRRRDRDRDGGDALGHGHGALDPRRAPPAREIPSGLSVDTVDIRPLRNDERPAGQPLWEGYLPSYKTPLPAAQNYLAGARLPIRAEPMHLLGAYV